MLKYLPINVQPTAWCQLGAQPGQVRGGVASHLAATTRIILIRREDGGGGGGGGGWGSYQTK